MILRLKWMAVVLIAPLSAHAQETYHIDVPSVRACAQTIVPLGGEDPTCVGEAALVCASDQGETTTATVGCLTTEAFIWETILSEVYAEALDHMEEQDTQLSYSLSSAFALQEAHRAWFAFRDAECAMRWANWQDGTIRGPISASCTLELTAARVFDLRALMAPLVP